MPTPRETVRLHFPWDVPIPLQISPAYHLIRTHGDYIATAGTGMNPTDLTRTPHLDPTSAPPRRVHRPKVPCTAGQHPREKLTPGSTPAPRHAAS